MKLCSLLDYVDECRTKITRAGYPRERLDGRTIEGARHLRERAADAVLDTWGPIGVAELANVAGLALSLSPIVAHRLRPTAVATVHETEIHALPGEPPRLLAGGAFLVQVADHLTSHLFPVGELRCFAVGGYRVLDQADVDAGREPWILVGLTAPDGCFVARWNADWSERDLDVPLDPRTMAMGAAERGALREFGQKAALFTTTLGLLLDADASPLETLDESERGKGPPKGKAKPPLRWISRYVSISEAHRRATAEAARPTASAAAGELLEVLVRGHVKRQRHGAGRAEVRTIYVAPYRATRHTAGKPTRVVVS